MEDNSNRSDKKNKSHIAALIVIAIISIISLIMVIYLSTKLQQQNSIQEELNDKNQMNVISLNSTIKKLEQSQKQRYNSLANKYEDLKRKIACPGVTYHFPRSNQIEDYVRYLSYVPQMKEVTACAWFESDGISDISDTVISYLTNSQDNITSIFNQKGVAILSLALTKGFPLAVTQGKFHVCATISTIKKKLVVFVNGSEVRESVFVNNGQLRGGGKLIMGQNQALVNYTLGLDPLQAFRGNITNLMVWPRVLTPQKIMSIASSCNCPPDYAVAMTTDRSELHGQVSYFVPEKCPTL